jgi:hypothetical protein
MRKRHVLPLQEILADDITIVQDYIEDAFGMFMTQFLDTSSGVIRGLAVSSGGVATLSIATGYIYQDAVYGQLESTSGLVLSLPASGTRTDLIVASYVEVLDQAVTGKVLLSVDTGQTTTQTNPKRKFGGILIEQLTGTNFAARPSNKIPLAEITVDSSTVTAISDVRIYSRIQRLQQDFQQNFVNMFYAGF